MTQVRDLVVVEGAKKGGGGARAAVEEKDSLRSTQLAQVVDLLSEGEVQGLVNGLQSVYLDGVPVQNADGSKNFDNVTFAFAPGTQGQAALPGFDTVQNELPVGVAVPKAVPVVRTITNPAVDAVRVSISVPQLSRQETTTGDLLGSSFEWAIEVQSAGGGFVERMRETVTGKTMSAYTRSKKIDLRFAGAKPIDVRVKRISDDSGSAAIVNAFNWQSYTEIQSLKLRYPNSCVAALEVSAQQFQRVPTRAYDLLGIRVRVPLNYDPLTKVYSGVWNGTFKVAWTDNPAWIFFELATNPRYGLGSFVSDAQLDKWSLYAIGQYCDGMVPDGRGGMEPRFACNLVLQTREQAFKVLQDLAALFRAIVFWAGGMVQVVQDAPSDPQALYSAANVVDGRFTYQGASERQRHSVFICYWNELAQLGKRVPEVFAPDHLVARYGIRELELAPIGVWRRGQAQRLCRWAAYSEEAEGESVTFRVGADGALVLPGQIFKIADPSEAGERLGGRVRSASTTQVTLDAAVTLNAGESYTLSVLLPDPADGTRYVTQERAVTTGAGTASVLAVSPAFTQAPAAESIWTLQSNLIAQTTWRCFAVSEIEELDQYEITAISHDPAKFALIELGVIAEQRPVSRLSSNAARPTGLALTETVYSDAQTFKLRLTVAWIPAAKGLAHQVSWRFERGAWSNLPPTDGQTVDIGGFDKGLVEVAVRALNALGSMSPPLEGSINLGGNLAAAADVTGLTLSLAAGGVLITCERSPDFDYTGTEYRVGPLPWATAPFITRKDSTSHIWGWLPAGTHHVLAKHYRRGGPPSVGTAQASITFSAPTPLLTVLNNHLTDAQFAAALKNRIDQIDGFGSGSVNARIEDEAIERAQAVLDEAIARTAADANLQTQISSITSQAEPFEAWRVWDFLLAQLDGWSATGAAFFVTQIQAVVQSSSSDPILLSPPALGIDSVSYDKVKVRLRRLAGTGWQGTLYYENDQHSFSESFRAVAMEPSWAGPGGWATLEFDCAALAAGGDDWALRLVTRIRLDFGNTPADSFGIDWIAIGRRGVGVSQAAFSSEQTTRANADVALATSVTSLDARVGGAEADITTVEAAVASNEAATVQRIDRLVAQRAGNVLNSDPWVTSLDYWSATPFFHLPQSGQQLQPAPVGEAARNALRATAIDGTYINMPALPVDATKRYRVSCRARRNPAALSGRLYLLVGLWRADQSLINGDGSYWFYPAIFVDPGATPQSYSGEFGAGTARPFPGDARWMAAGMLLMHVGGNPAVYEAGGWMEGWDLQLTDETQASSLQAQITNVQTAQVSGDAALAQQVTTIRTGLQQGAGNRLRNSSFESDGNGDGIADGFNPYNNGGATVTYALVPGFGGGKAQQFDFLTATANTQGFFTDAGMNPDWEPGKTYVIAGYAQGEGGQAGLPLLHTWNVHPAVTETLLNPPLSPSVWQRYAFRITWGGSVEGVGRLYIYSVWSAARGGKLRFDKWSVTEGPELLPYEGAADVQTFASRYALEVDANGRVASISLLSQADAGGAGGSSIKFRADRLSVGHPSIGPGDQELFVVYTSDTTIDGVFIPAGVYVKSAFIERLDGIRIKARSIETERLIIGSVSANVAATAGAESGADSYPDAISLAIAATGGYLRASCSGTVHCSRLGVGTLKGMTSTVTLRRNGVTVRTAFLAGATVPFIPSEATPQQERVQLAFAIDALAQLAPGVYTYTLSFSIQDRNALGDSTVTSCTYGYSAAVSLQEIKV